MDRVTYRGAMLRTAQRVQRDGHYESTEHCEVFRALSAATLAAAALYPRALRLSSHGERLQPVDLHEHARPQLASTCKILGIP